MVGHKQQLTLFYPYLQFMLHIFMLISVTNNFQIRGTILSTSNKESSSSKKAARWAQQNSLKILILDPISYYTCSRCPEQISTILLLSKKKSDDIIRKSQRDNKKGAWKIYETRKKIEDDKKRRVASEKSRSRCDFGAVCCSFDDIFFSFVLSMYSM